MEDATVWTFHIREGVNWVDKDGNVVAPVTANDWVSSAHYACDANNDSDTFYTMSGVIAGADAYYDWTAYQMALPDATDGTDKDGNAVKFITNEDGEQEILEEVPEASIDDIGVKAVDDIHPGVHAGILPPLLPVHGFLRPLYARVRSFPG